MQFLSCRRIETRGCIVRLRILAERQRAGTVVYLALYIAELRIERSERKYTIPPERAADREAREKVIDLIFLRLILLISSVQSASVA
jgi:hypothetical protein